MSEWIYDATGADTDRIAVLDIGSNSVRLVIYDRLDRLPLSLFNEKVLCGLGRNLEQDGHLHPEGRREAITALERFAVLIRAMNIRHVIPLATASLRDAIDGPDFIAEVAAKTGLQIQVISGDEEARLAALGVLSAMPSVHGVMGDLGGGSLEMVGMHSGALHDRVSLPIGPLRFLRPKTERSDITKIIDRALNQIAWLGDYRGLDFIAVGGAWRALAKLHIEQSGHPLNIVHHYTMTADTALSFMELMARQSRTSVERMSGFSRRRAESLPLTAFVMIRILEHLAPRKLVFSAYGLREGVLFDLLSNDQRQDDPLLSGCQVIASRNQRFSMLVDHLVRWTAPLFADETAPLKRLRHAACLLADFCWAEHPEYRAKHAFLRVLRLPFVGITHEERVFLALVALYRYGGVEDRDTHPVSALLSQTERDRAHLLGLALQLALSMTGGAVPLLEGSALIWQNGALDLVCHTNPALVTERIEKRIHNLRQLSLRHHHSLALS